MIGIELGMKKQWSYEWRASEVGDKQSARNLSALPTILLLFNHIVFLKIYKVIFLTVK